MMKTILIFVFKALSTILWFKYDSDRVGDGKTTDIFGFEISSKNLYLSYAIIATVFTVALLYFYFYRHFIKFLFLKVIFLLILIITRKRISLVVKLFAEAQKAIIDMPIMLVMPVLTFVFYFIFLAYWIFTALVLASFGIFFIFHRIF